MKRERRPAEVFPPGEYLRDELQERGWNVTQLAERAVVPAGEILAVLDGGTITGRLSERLGIALGVSPWFWAGLSVYWQKYRKCGAK